MIINMRNVQYEKLPVAIKYDPNIAIKKNINDII